MMSTAHGSNDVANAVTSWVAACSTFMSGDVNSISNTPVWILIAAGFLLGAGSWFLGYRIVRSMGTGITRVNPTCGYSIELGTAIAVLLVLS
ncbi:phosphate transporter [Rhexocercosporidium sp. MPI-PUGE-AT-0058]|nr:phosphate transporter [Rhexocercosporidium sp. MPI-PUGE-AT-0058]